MTNETFNFSTIEVEPDAPKDKLPGCYGLDEPNPLTSGELAAVNRQYRKESEHTGSGNGSEPSYLAPGLEVSMGARAAKGPAGVRENNPWLTRDHREEAIKV